jgi:very-short-patch-repair endonuclease
VAEGLQGVVASLESGAVPLASAPDHFEYSYRNWWLKKTLDTEPVLRGFSSADHERKIHEFKQADAKFQKLTEQYIAATLAGRVPSSTSAAVGADSEMGKLRRQLQMQRRQMPLRSLVQSLPTLLPRLKPCLLMSPLSVAQYLEAGHAPFDLVVFDEASQIPVWEAVGAIARGKQVVVVGDPKQLPPTNFFGRSTEGDGDDAGEEQVEDLESILDECLGAGMNRLSLQWHYRSKHESLITFSNVRYYDSQLVTFPSPVTDDVAVRFERVAGVYDRGGSRTNRAEAEAAVNAIEAHFLTVSNAERSLGVVTFNQPQQDLINTLLDARRRTNTALDRAIAQAADEPLFVKNLENVQGDERDVIFFSIAYGPDAAGKTTMNFGPLNGEGGHRRLNVAISRAREAVVIFSTLMPEQIDLARVRAAGVRDLKNYLEFAIRGPSAILAQSLPTGREPDSPFEVAVLRMLRDRGWDIHPQVGCSDYRIDMAVVDPRAPGRYLVGIECDGRTYHSGATARDRDRLRQHVLESLGWRIHRIWSTDWWINPDREIDKIDEWLRYLVDAEETSPVETARDSASLPDLETLDESAAHAAPLPAAPQAQGPLKIYRVCTLTPGDPVAFYEPGSNAKLAMQIAEVVAVEGPVLEAVLFRRVARAWGLERTGSRIVERLRYVMPKSVIKLQEDGGTFYCMPTNQDDTRPDFRIASADENSRRRVEEVSLTELGALVLHVLDQGGATPRAEVARAVCRLVGMARMPGDAELRLHRAVDELIAKKQLVEVDDLLRAASP